MRLVQQQHLSPNQLVEVAGMNPHHPPTILSKGEGKINPMAFSTKKTHFKFLIQKSRTKEMNTHHVIQEEICD